ncbi:phosphopantetheine-binding protein [Streptomyces sp. NPDC058646]|uniref:phosphopantetheine-binding protein n=1 Tax=Streptomyces sp. NPDC058646 TaxID=3346574 RepID=UPI003660A6B3
MADTPDERAVAEIWSGVIGLEQVRPQDNFFDLGGNSILAARVSAQFAARFGVDPVDGLEALFDADDLAHTVELLRAATGRTDR